MDIQRASKLWDNDMETPSLAKQKQDFWQCLLLGMMPAASCCPPSARYNQDFWQHQADFSLILLRMVGLKFLCVLPLLFITLVLSRIQSSLLRTCWPNLRRVHLLYSPVLDWPAKQALTCCWLPSLQEYLFLKRPQSGELHSSLLKYKQPVMHNLLWSTTRRMPKSH